MTEFKVSEGEANEAKEWQDSHHCKVSDALRNDAISCIKSSPFKWVFGQTGIGYTVTTRCECGEEKNVTDYSLW